MDYGFPEWLERFRAVRAEGFRPALATTCPDCLGVIKREPEGRGGMTVPRWCACGHVVSIAAEYSVHGFEQFLGDPEAKLRAGLKRAD